MKSHRRERLEGVCAHLLLVLRPPREGVDVDFEGVKSGSGNSLGCPRVDTILLCIGGGSM